MTTATVEDYRWLLSNTAKRYLQDATHSSSTSVQLTQSLRKDLSIARTHLILEQTTLRQRAKKKFSAAAEMFFTVKGLEQATSQAIATYKAVRFGKHRNVADLCCGIGGDLMALTKNSLAAGIESDEITAMLANQNAKLVDQHSGVFLQDVNQADLSKFDAFHIDPDRRADGKRTSQIQFHEPGEAFLTELIANHSYVSMKLAPAAKIPTNWQPLVEAEWIGHERECKQLVLWGRGFSKDSLASGVWQRRVTILNKDGDVVCSHLTTECAADASAVTIPVIQQPITKYLGRYLYEPHAAVLAAKMSSTLASQYSLQAIARNIAYLTSDQLIAEPAFAAFEVIEVLPYHLRKIKALLKQRAIGNLELKQRGVQLNLIELAKTLKNKGDQSATLFLTKRSEATIAILARRINERS